MVIIKSKKEKIPRILLFYTQSVLVLTALCIQLQYSRSTRLYLLKFVLDIRSSLNCPLYTQRLQ